MSDSGSQSGSARIWSPSLYISTEPSVSKRTHVWASGVGKTAGERGELRAGSGWALPRRNLHLRLAGEIPHGRRVVFGDRDREAMDREQEFSEIFKANYHKIVYYFRRANLPEEDCRELANDVFLRAYDGFDRFRGDAKPSTWLNKIARNLLLNHLRGKATGKRNAAVESLDSESAPTLADVSVKTPEEELIWEEMVLRMRHRIALLPNQMRTCVEFRIQGLDYQEIATQMKISIQTVKSHLHQATAKLKAMTDPPRGAK